MQEDAAQRVGKRGENRRLGSKVVLDPPLLSTKLHPSSNSRTVKNLSGIARAGKRRARVEG